MPRHSLKRMQPKHLSLHLTVPSVEAATALSNILLERRLVACINTLPSTPSRYWWAGKIAEDNEILLIAKTRSDKKQAIFEAVSAHHPDEVPCVVFLPIDELGEPYKKWLDEVLDAG